MNSQAKQQRIPTVARYLLGVIFFVFGLNGFLNFLPAPPLPEGPAGAFIGGLVTSGYMFPLIKGTEVLAAIALLSNRFSPLALIVLAPVTVNIVLFHAILAPAGIILPLVVLAAHLTAAWGYRSLYQPLLVAKPAVVPASEPARVDRAASATA
ncbi:MAG: DoxX family protein [Polyangiaceae bacterium]|nr:DoxX family protein [Polyangiaceae bacterium]